MYRSRLLPPAALMLVLLLSACTAPLDSCQGPPRGWAYDGLGAPMPRLSTVPKGLRIVTLGSSSTEGVGASRPDLTYPAQLQRILDRRFPDDRIEVINRGVAQEVVASNLVRLDRDVLSLSPDLVIWQVGTNDAIYLRDFVSIMDQVNLGIGRIRKSGARVALLSPQVFFDPARDQPISEMNEDLRKLALARQVPFLDRHQLMSWWANSGALYPDEILGEDELHMTDRSYECLAIRIADIVPALARGAIVRQRS